MHGWVGDNHLGDVEAHMHVKQALKTQSSASNFENRCRAKMNELRVLAAMDQPNIVQRS